MAKKTAIIKQIEGLTFAGKADSGHWITIDSPASVGGANGGPDPKELLMLSLAGCTGSDVASILKKKRVPYTGLEVHVSGETREEHPRVFTSLHVHYVVSGEGVKARDVERSIELSETKYCGVSAMLSKSVEITRSYLIEPSGTNGKEPDGEQVSEGEVKAS